MADISLRVNASTNQGVYSPNSMGNMYEWATDYMNGSWAERVSNRNFEIDVVNFFASPLYDHFPGETLDQSKWTQQTLDGAGIGTCTVSDSILEITGISDAKFGVLSRNIRNTIHAQTTIKATLAGYTGTGAMVSLNGAFGESLVDNIEFGIVDGNLTVSGDGIPTYTGPAAITPVELKIVVGNMKGTLRDISFYADNVLIHTVLDFDRLPQYFHAFVYSVGNSVSRWDSISFFSNSLYENFDGVPINNRFEPATLEGNIPGSVEFSNSQAIITGGFNSRYGLLSQAIRSSSVYWTYIEAKLDMVEGVNGLLNIFGNRDGEFADFVEFGVENGRLQVYTKSGIGNWTGAAATLPCTLRVELSPYYANGRFIRFFYNDNIVYALWHNPEVPKPDYRIFLYGYSNSVTAWDWVTIHQERFRDPYSPNFEGADLPYDWVLDSLNGGAFGTINSHDGICTIYGVEDSRFGIGGTKVEDSDIKPFRVVAKLLEYSGHNALLHITTLDPQTGFDEYVEFGVEDGKLIVYTPTGSWAGPQAVFPVYLTVDISAYGPNGRTITFISNGEPIYTLENTTVLADDAYRIFLYGYGASTTVWDYADLYATESWMEDGYQAWGAIYLDDAEEAVSGFYSQKIVANESRGGSIGVSHSGVVVTAGNLYRVSLWAKCSEGINGIKVILCENAPLNSGYPVYAEADIIGINSEMQKFTIELMPDATNNDAKIFIGALGTGELWIDQVSVMPLDPSEVVYGGWRRDFVENLIELNPGTLRWPGGILSDYYFWSDGIGEVDKRPPLHFTQWTAEWLNNDVGIDEFLQLCEALNIRAVININYGSATAEYAAQFVEYVNGDASTVQGAIRAENGRVEPYGIQFWEIGNEVWGDWVPGHTSAEQFAADFVVFYEAMKAVDPTIMCIGEGGDGNSFDQSWNQTLLDYAADKLSEISIHYYSPQKLPVAYDNHDVFLATVAAPVSVRERMAATQSIISASGQDIKIAVTEYNAMYSATMLHLSMHMLASLQVAGLLNVFFEYPGLTGNNFYSCLANFWAGSTMRFGRRGIFLTPSYHVLWMYANHRGDMKVASKMESPTFSNPEIGNVPAMNDVPYLESLVTRNLAGDKLFISLLNRSDQEAFSVPISIEGVTAVSATASAWTVTADHFLDLNSWHEPTKIVRVETQISDAGINFTHDVPKLSVTVIELSVSGLIPIVNPVICGIVIDTHGVPVPDANIITSDGLRTLTDANGYYEIPTSEGLYSVTASKTGYDSFTMENIYVFPVAGTMAQPIVLNGDYTQHMSTDRFRYLGVWRGNYRSDHGTYHYSMLATEPEASLEFAFRGTAFKVIGLTGGTFSKFAVYIDGEFVTEVNTYDPVSAKFQVVLYENNSLTDGIHTVKLVVLPSTMLIHEVAFSAIDVRGQLLNIWEVQ